MRRISGAREPRGDKICTIGRRTMPTRRVLILHLGAVVAVLLMSVSYGD